MKTPSSYDIPGHAVGVRQAAEVLGVSPGRVGQMMAEGRIEAAGKVGRTPIFLLAALKRFRRKGPQGRDNPRNEGDFRGKRYPKKS